MSSNSSIRFSLPKQTLPAAKVLPVDEEDAPEVVKKSQTVKESEAKAVSGISESGRVSQNAAAGKKSGSESGDWPQSLKDYVNQAFAKCKTDQEKDEVEHLLKSKLTVAYNNNTVWTTDWKTEPPLVPFKPSAAGRPAASPPPSHSYKKSTKPLVRAKRVSRSRRHSSSSSSYRSSSSRSRSRSPIDRRRRPQPG